MLIHHLLPDDQHIVATVRSSLRHDGGGPRQLLTNITIIIIINITIMLQVFRDNKIDGGCLPLLTESHLTTGLGLKLGPALKLLTALRSATLFSFFCLFSFLSCFSLSL